MLMDVLRKLITGHLTRIISNFWVEHNILRPSSHAFIGKQGTHTAELQLLNALETAKEWKSRIYLASIDMKKAFDSLGRPLQIYALVRAGVPHEIATFMVNMDSPSITVVRTPFALAHWQTYGYHNLDKLGFMAEKGTAQGDKPSPCIWVAVNDILATAWSSLSSGHLYYQDDKARIYPVLDIIYADDNLAISGEFNSLQTKMDLLSAFCIIMAYVLKETPLHP